MKSKLFLLSFLMLLSVATNYAQGIAVQGIARDANNTARVSKVLNLTFKIYYLPDVEANTIYEDTKSVTTDAFGVFSAVLEPLAERNFLIANNYTLLRISEGSTIISDELLRQVPYAIAASNGVPVGSIMPYMGATAPTGWWLCDGTTLPATATALKALLKIDGNTGDKTPDLRGMFLRGASDNGDPALHPSISEHNVGTIQHSSNKSHLHNQGTLVTSRNEKHNHGSNSTEYKVMRSGIDTNKASLDNTVGEPDLLRTYEIPLDGDHIHIITGETGNTGDIESRPINYAVNYIIKL